MAVITVLSPVSARDLATTTLLNQVAQFNAERLAAEQLAVSNDFQGRINTVNLDAANTQALADDLGVSVKLLEDVVTRVATIRALADSLLTTIVQSASASTSEIFAANARNFDSFVGRIETEAASTRFSPNLLAASIQRNFVFETTEAGATESVSGRFLASDYTITETVGGEVWVRDGGSPNILRQTDGTTGAPTGKFASITGGIQLDSFSTTTGIVVFTIAPTTNDAEQITGTLSTSGLGILDAWLYAGLESLDGRTRATTDIEEAKRTLDLELARYGRFLDSANFYLGRTDVGLSGFNNLIDDFTLSQAIKLQELETEFGRLDSLTTVNIFGAQTVRNEFLNLLRGGTTPFVRSLIDILA